MDFHIICKVVPFIVYRVFFGASMSASELFLCGNILGNSRVLHQSCIRPALQEQRVSLDAVEYCLGAL
jgi:hypothetical protein